MTARPTRRLRRPPAPLAFTLAELVLSSWETMARRTWMMLDGSCSSAEYQRMVREKADAAHHSALAMLTFPGDLARALAPWHRRAGANARRLRRKG